MVIAAGRCPFTTDGLLALADLVDRLRARRDGDRDCKEDYAVNVKGIMPHRLPGRLTSLPSSV